MIDCLNYGTPSCTSSEHLQRHKDVLISSLTHAHACTYVRMHPPPPLQDTPECGLRRSVRLGAKKQRLYMGGGGGGAWLGFSCPICERVREGIQRCIFTCGMM